jgi:type VI secretion system Hcp family effector
MKRLLILIFLGALSAMAYGQTEMVVRIEANGELITEGEGPIALGGVDTTEYASVLSYGWFGQLATPPDSGLVTSRREYGPLRIVKPLARSSVLLRKALDQNQQIEVTLRLFAADGVGATQEVYRIDLTGGRVAGIRPFSDGASGQYLEELRVAWEVIEFTDVQTGTSHLIQFPLNP